MSLKLVVAPGSEPVSLAEVKAQCRVDVADDDALLGMLIMAAREMAEHNTGRALITQTWELVVDAFPAAFVLRKSPIASVVSVKYIDTAGTEQTLDLADTLLDKDSEPGYLVPAYGKGWPATQSVPNAVRVRYTAGYGEAADVPSSIKHWMLLAIGTWYAQRETLVPGSVYNPPRAFWDGLLDPYRLYEIA